MDDTTSKPILSNAKCVAGLAAIVLAVAGLRIAPDVSRAGEIEGEIVQLNSEIKQLSASDDLIGRLTETRDKLRSFGEGRITEIPDRNDVAGFVTKLSSTFDKAGLKGREITSQNEQVMDDVVKTPMVVRATGEFLQIYDVLRQLEHMPRLMRVGRLRIERETKSARGQVTHESAVSADILIEAFYEDASKTGAEGSSR